MKKINNGLISKDYFIFPSFAAFFIGFFIPHELYKSLSYLGIAVFFIFNVFPQHFSVKNLFQKEIIYLFAFFLLHLIALIYSENIDEGIRITVLRLPLLFVPAFIYYSRFLTIRQREKIEFSYAFICIAAGLIGLLYRIYYIYFVDFNTNWLYNDNLVSIYRMQAVYYGIYLCIASLFLTKTLLHPQKKGKLLLISGLLLSTLFMFLLASRTSLILYFLINTVVVYYYGLRKNKKVIPIFIAALLSLLLSLFVFFPTTIKRFKSITNVEFNFKKQADYYHFGEKIDEEKWNGLNSRLALWLAAIETVKKQYLLGSGTGDKQDVLMETYQKLNFKLGLERNFGTHNQYLESLVMFGLIGLVLLLIALWVALRAYLQSQNIISALIIFCFIICFLTEDFLSRNQGVVLFSFFYAYFASSKLETNS